MDENTKKKINTFFCKHFNKEITDPYDVERNIARIPVLDDKGEHKKDTGNKKLYYKGTVELTDVIEIILLTIAMAVILMLIVGIITSAIGYLSYAITLAPVPESTWNYLLVIRGVEVSIGIFCICYLLIKIINIFDKLLHIKIAECPLVYPSDGSIQSTTALSLYYKNIEEKKKEKENKKFNDNN